MDIDPSLKDAVINNSFLDIKLHYDEICCAKFHKWINELTHENQNIIIIKAILNQDLFTISKYASLDDHNALVFMGGCYTYGFCVDKDITKGYQYFSKAAEQGSISAKLALTGFYISGTFVPKDYNRAIAICNEIIDLKSIMGIRSLKNVIDAIGTYTVEESISIRNKAYARLIKAGNNYGLVGLANEMLVDSQQDLASFSRAESLLLKAHNLKVIEGTGLLGYVYLTRTSDPEKQKYGRELSIQAALKGERVGFTTCLSQKDLFEQIKPRFKETLLLYIANHKYMFPLNKIVILKEIGEYMVSIVKENLYEYSQYPHFREALSIFGIMVK